MRSKSHVYCAAAARAASLEQSALALAGSGCCAGSRSLRMASPEAAPRRLRSRVPGSQHRLGERGEGAADLRVPGGVSALPHIHRLSMPPHGARKVATERGPVSKHLERAPNLRVRVAVIGAVDCQGASRALLRLGLALVMAQRERHLAQALGNRVVAISEQRAPGSQRSSSDLANWR